MSSKKPTRTQINAYDRIEAVVDRDETDCCDGDRADIFASDADNDDALRDCAGCGDRDGGRPLPPPVAAAAAAAEGTSKNG